MGKLAKLNQEDDRFYSMCQKRAWTPCKHFPQCIGFCPLCIRDYIKEITNVQPQKETTAS